MEKISVIVPVYNAEQYLNRCLDSIIRQTYKNIEILLIDDGSTDKSLDICKEYENKDARIIVIHQENKGVSAARNNGLEHAVGEYIAFVDSDDYIDTNMYQSMLEISRRYNADIVLCDCLKEYKDHSALYTHPIREGFYNKNQLEEEYYQHLIMMENIEYPATISNWLMLIKNNNVPRYIEGIKYSEDLLFGAQAVFSASSFYYMKGSAYYHYNCTNANSATHVYHEDKWENYQQLHKYTKDYFQDIIFDEQIAKMLVFFVYNTLNDIRFIDIKGKKSRAMTILNDPEVRKAFNTLKIYKLPITNKLKLLTLLYKYRIGVGWIFRG